MTSNIFLQSCVDFLAIGIAKSDGRVQAPVAKVSLDEKLSKVGQISHRNVWSTFSVGCPFACKKKKGPFGWLFFSGYLRWFCPNTCLFWLLEAPFTTVSGHWSCLYESLSACGGLWSCGWSTAAESLWLATMYFFDHGEKRFLWNFWPQPEMMIQFDWLAAYYVFQMDTYKYVYIHKFTWHLRYVILTTLHINFQVFQGFTPKEWITR